MALKNSDLRVPVGGPLYLAEARYLQHELARIGLKAKIRRDPSSASRRGCVHVVLVSPEDAEAAELARHDLLDDSEAPDEAPGGSEPQYPRKSALVLAVLGFVTGLRVGARALGSVWLGIALAAILSALAFFVTRTFFGSPRQ